MIGNPENVEIDYPPNKDSILNLSVDEQKTLLYMTLDSLRGNWSNIERRCEIVELLTNELPSDAFDDVDLDSVWSTNSIFYRPDDTARDGRIFRRYYEHMEDEVLRDRETVSFLSGIIYNDMSWTAFRIDQFCGDTDT